MYENDPKEVRDRINKFYMAVAENRKKNKEIARKFAATGDIPDADLDYVLIYKDVDNIVDEIEFDNIEDKEITRAIINSLEHEAANQLKKKNTVNIPYLCNLAIDPVMVCIQQHSKDFYNAKKTKTKEEYQSYIRAIINQARAEAKAVEVRKRMFSHFKVIHKKEYEKKKQLMGKTYADCWIKFMYCFQAIDYNEELSDAIIDYYGQNKS